MKKTIIFDSAKNKDKVLNGALNMGWQAWSLNELAITVIVPKGEATSLAILLILEGGNFKYIK